MPEENKILTNDEIVNKVLDLNEVESGYRRRVCAEMMDEALRIKDRQFNKILQEAVNHG